MSPRALLTVSSYSSAGHAVVDHAPARLDVGRLPLDDDGPQGDARIHVAGEIDVADGPGIRTALVGLDLVDDLHGPHLGAPETVPAGRPARRASNAEHSGRSRPLTFDVMCITCEYRSTFMTSVSCDGPVLGDPADVVAAQVHQHDVLGPLLGVGEQFVGQGPVFLLAPAAATGPGQGADRHDPLLDPHEDLRRAADQGEIAERQVEQERAGIDDAQHPVDVERVGAGLDLEPLAGHDLEDVARLDVFLAVADDLLVPLAGEVGPERQRGAACRCRCRRRPGRGRGRPGARPARRPGRTRRDRRRRGPPTGRRGTARPPGWSCGCGRTGPCGRRRRTRGRAGRGRPGGRRGGPRYSGRRRRRRIRRRRRRTGAGPAWARRDAARAVAGARRRGRRR